MKKIGIILFLIFMGISNLILIVSVHNWDDKRREISHQSEDLKSYLILLNSNSRLDKIFKIMAAYSSNLDLDTYRKMMYSEFRHLYFTQMDRVTRFIRGHGGIVKYRIYSLGLLSVNAPLSVIRKLMSEGLILGAIRNFKVYVALNVAVRAIGADAFWVENITGGFYGDKEEGVEVAIVDTGIDLNDKYINSSVIASKSFVSGEDAYDYNGHGTLVASIVASSHYIYRGVAFKARIINAKAMNAVGEGNADDILVAIEWALTNVTDTADIINLSIGTFDLTPDGNSFLTRAIDYMAYIYKALIVVAIGNIENNKNWVNAPADGFNVIAVGSINDQRTINRNDDVISYFSCIGPTKDGRIKPDVVAPGENIYVPRSGNLYMVSGTSFSTPIVSGSLALLYDYLYHRGLNITEIPLLARALLLYSADDWGDLGPDNIYGFGYINLKRILNETPYLSLISFNESAVLNINISNSQTIRLAVADWRIPAGVDTFYEKPSIYILVYQNASKITEYGPFKEANFFVDINIPRAGTYKILIVRVASKIVPYSPLGIAINTTFVAQNGSNILEVMDIPNDIIYDNGSYIVNVTIINSGNETLRMSRTDIISSGLKINTYTAPTIIGPNATMNIILNVTPLSIGEKPIILVFSNESTIITVPIVIFVKDDDVEPPTIDSFEIKIESGSIKFFVKAHDASGISRVIVNWTVALVTNISLNESGGAVNLSYDSNKNVWFGSIPITRFIEGKTVKFYAWVYDNDTDWEGDSLYSVTSKVVTVVEPKSQLWIFVLSVVLVIVIVMFLRHLNKRTKNKYIIEI